jgi:hypothetical protein
MLKSLSIGYEEIACGQTPHGHEDSIWVGEITFFGRFEQ